VTTWPVLFASDLHGSLPRYLALLAAMVRERPAGVFLGGDLLPSGGLAAHEHFLLGWLGPRLAALRAELKAAYPRVLAIFGNDDPRAAERALAELEAQALLEHVHGRRTELGAHAVFGYAYGPPTPFALKDWERYDVSRFVDPGCVSPEEGRRSVPVAAAEARWSTIASDLETLVGRAPLAGAVFLFHAPPHGTRLDRAALDRVHVEHAPLDPHVGSIAIRRFLEARQPMLALHGHVHESARLTGCWRDRVGRTLCLSAAHDGPELALVRFDLDAPEGAVRELL
jgi:Icc-related predicted phosphoesterase